MNEVLREKLEQRMNRRGFLRGSALAAAAVVSAAAFPIGALAQSQSAQAPAEKKEDPADKKADEGAEKKDPKPAEQDETKITRKDENGRDYRICPQCGFNMYRQDRTWTCENCGYSYTE